MKGRNPQRLSSEDKRERGREHDQRRGSARQRGYTSRWEKARLVFLRANPLCAMCDQEGRVGVATVVDHKIPHKGDQALFWDQSNWQPLCQGHHNRDKRSAEQGFKMTQAIGQDGWPIG